MIPGEPGIDTMIERRSAGTADAVTMLRIDHGPVNALDLDLCRALAAALSGAAQQEGPVVLTGSGRAFSAGVDLTRLLTEGDSYLRQFLPALDELFRTVFALPVPVVAAVNGHAIAGGAILAAAADRVLMTPGKAGFGVPELRLGVPLPRSAFEVIRDRVGATAARDVIFEAGTYSPAEAAAVGLVDEIVEEDLLERAVVVAEELGARTAPDTFAMTKSQLRHEARQRIEADALDETVRVWSSRVEDGWISRYLDSVKARSSRTP